MPVNFQDKSAQSNMLINICHFVLGYHHIFALSFLSEVLGGMCVYLFPLVFLLQLDLMKYAGWGTGDYTSGSPQYDRKEGKEQRS